MSQVTLCVLYILVFYASQCEVLMGSVFSPCHGYISPNIYQQQCRYQACHCGSSCLCTALAHYAYLCSKHGVHINFRSQVSECGERLCVRFMSQLIVCMYCKYDPRRLIFGQVWCVSEVCCTTPAFHHADGLAELFPARRRVTLTTVRRGVAVQTAATMMMYANAVSNCKSLSVLVTYTFQCNVIKMV